MIEATPGIPYGSETIDLRAVERNMAMRRYRITSALPSNIYPFSIVNFPLLGTIDCVNPARTPGGPFSQSAYVSDACISPHPRFGTLTANIRKRRGRKVVIHVPIFKDTNTTVDAAGQGGVTNITNPIFCQSCTPCMGMPNTEATIRADNAEIEEKLLASPKISSSSSTNTTDTLTTTTYPLTNIENIDTSSGPTYIPKDGAIHMDAMTFGMGCCCLQVTFQARDLQESLYLYDQLAIMAPIMMALTGNTPVWRGYLADTDTRWDVIAASVDCRTPIERGMENEETLPEWMNTPNAVYSASNGKRRIQKSRYSSIDCYISNSARCDEKYNDIDIQYDQEAFTELCNAGIDEKLARHVAHLFIRDPLVIFSERITVDDTLTAEHFENIQSTNWRSVRWKPPPPDSPSIGWRVELRTMEAQITDFENAAFTVFVTLLSRVMLFFDLNLYIPLSKVDENLSRASKREAASKEKFYFRTRVTDRMCTEPVTPSSISTTNNGSLLPTTTTTTTTNDHPPANCHCGIPFDLSSPLPESTANNQSSPNTNEYEEMTIVQILLGKGPDFPGLIPLMHLYLDFIKCDEETRNMINAYNAFIIRRATGESCTGATYQRNFIRNHKDYKYDSVVAPSIVYDLLDHLQQLANGKISAEGLLGKDSPKHVFVFTEEILEAVRKSTESLVKPTEDNGRSSIGSTSSTISRSSILSTSSSVTLHVTPEEVQAHPLLPVPLENNIPSILHNDDDNNESPIANTGDNSNKSTGIIGYPHYPSSIRMRGASFAEEEAIVYECNALVSLVQLYREKFGLIPRRRSTFDQYPNSPGLRGLQGNNNNSLKL